MVSTQRLFANKRKYKHNSIQHQMAGCQRGLSLSKLAMVNKIRANADAEGQMCIQNNIKKKNRNCNRKNNL